MKKIKSYIFCTLVLFLTTSCNEGLIGDSKLSAVFCDTTNYNLVQGLENGRFGGNQVFDVQRSPAYPSVGSNFRVHSFANPIRDSGGGSYTLAAGESLQLFKAGGTITQNGQTGCNVGIRLIRPDTTTAVIATGGGVWGLNGSDGFLHIGGSNDIGTFFSIAKGFSNGDELTYIPQTLMASCAQLDGLTVSATTLADGAEIPTCN